MTPCAIQLPEPFWQTAIPILSETFPSRLVACSADALQEADVARALSKEQLQCALIRGILPDDVALYLSESPAAAALKTLRENLLSAMVYASPLNPACFSLQLRLDRIQDDHAPERLQQLALFLKSLLTAPLDTEYDVALSIRYPYAFPKSMEWERALDICRRARHPHIGLCLHYHPNDMEDAPQLDSLLHPLAEHLRCLCFHYAPMQGETLFDDELEAWSQCLRDLNYHGQIVFCPEINDHSDFRTLCADAAAWARYFQ